MRVRDKNANFCLCTGVFTFGFRVQSIIEKIEITERERQEIAFKINKGQGIVRSSAAMVFQFRMVKDFLSIF